MICGSPSTRSKVSTGPIDPPAPMKTGALPKPASIARAAAMTTGWSREMTTGRTPPSLITVTRTPRGAVDSTNSVTTRRTCSGSCRPTSRAETFTFAHDGMIVLLPGP